MYFRSSAGRTSVEEDARATTGVTAPIGARDGTVQSSVPTQLPLAQSQQNSTILGSTAAFTPSPYSSLPPKTSAELALERRLSGNVFARVSESSTPQGGPAAPTLTSDGTVSMVPSVSSRSESDMAALLRPTAATSAKALVLPTLRFLLAKGAFIDCTLETAIDSTLPGVTTCITATDTFSVDGSVVLLERGTKLIGETRGEVQQGAARVFVLWTQARTPTGVVVPLDSPGTDELGRSGLPGEVDRHFWERFGAAILISTIDGVVQSAVQSTSHGNGAVVYSPSGSESVVTDVLKSTVNIPPTVRKRNGDRIQVFVARDLDFRSVYELHANPTAR
jgi:type IV secretion system protein VirB10